MRAAAIVATLAALALGLVLPALGGPRPVTWCGNDATAVDRKPDAVAGPQVHVVYAFPSDGPDRFGALASLIASDVAAIDAWWRREDPTRTLRFDLFAFPGCGSELGQLDISRVPLPRDSAAYRGAPQPGRLVMDDLQAAGLTAHGYKKYLVLYDGLVSDATTCGGGTLRPSSPTRGGPYEHVYMYIGTPRCATNQGQGGHLAWAMAHELVHNLGALPPGAPHPCTGQPFGDSHTCDDARDLMYGTFGLRLDGSLDDVVLDPGRDDYYGHNGSWWDVRDSAWLAHLDAPRHQLTVSIVGGGPDARVSSELPGIECPTWCSASWDAGTEVRLEARFDDIEYFRFVGWRDACTGFGPCVVSMDGPRTATAVLGPADFALRVSVVGSGRVVSGSWACARRCDERVSAGESFEFRAVPKRGWRFSGWTGSCRGRGLCNVRFDADAALRATFVRVKRR